MHRVRGWYRRRSDGTGRRGAPAGPLALIPGPLQLLVVLTSGRNVVLTIAKLGAGQESYYLSKVAQGFEDYYSGQGERPGTWMGRGAERLGLAAEVNGEELQAVLAGIDPATGERLAGRDGAKRIPGWDLTFSASKSVSVLYALGADGVAKEVAASHDAAVAASLEYLEKHATVSRRRVDGVITAVRGEGLVVAGFRHRTSRAGDPQLHTHALVANVVEHVDGGSGAVHSPVIYRHARTAGFVYQSVLRGELTDRLGVQWGEVHNGYAEIDGVDQRLLEVFSKRRAEIEAALAERGEDSARAAQVAAHRTRSSKEYGVDPQALHERWATEAGEVGVDPGTLATLLDRGAPQVDDGHLRDVIEELLSERGLTAQQASFDHRDVIRAWCVSLPAGVKVTLAALEDLADVVESDTEVVPVVDGRASLAGNQLLPRPDGGVTAPAVGERRWSTTDMLAVERRLLEAVGNEERPVAGMVDPATVDQALGKRPELAAEQAAMVRQLTTSGSPVEVVVGRAGTGKTYALAAAADIWRAAGYRPIGLGLAARAAHELETSAGIPSTTVARFLLDAGQAPGDYIDGRQVIVVDEAGMVDTRRLGRLVEHAQRAGAKVVLVGDHHQLPSVEAGGAFAGLVTRGVGRVTELTRNRRQRELWERDTLDRLRTGDGGRPGIESVVAAYNREGRLHVGATPAEVRSVMVADWYDARRRPGTVAMMALRRSDVDELNARARALLVAEGSVEEAGADVGDKTFGVGDRVVCLDNNRRIGVHNALFGTVIEADPDEGTVVIDPDGDHGLRLLPRDYVGQHLDHAYATTIHKAQGASYDRALLLGDDRLYRQAGYTGLSRGRDRNEIYLVMDDDRERDPDLEHHGIVEADHPVERFVRALNRDGAKRLAADELDARVVLASEPLSDLWARRDRLVGHLATSAPEQASIRLEEELGVARAKETQTTVTRTALEERVSQLNGLRWRREHQDAQRQLGRALDNEDRRRAERERVEATAQHAGQLETRWIAGHGSDLEHVADLDRAIARRSRLAGWAAEIDRPAHVVAVLGDPPVDLTGRDRWRAAVGAIESYRARWSIHDGTLEAPVGADQAAHLSAMRAVIEQVTDTRKPALDAVDLPD
jgi:conjugative relaxase-like TrwC/TraI family protein